MKKVTAYAPKSRRIRLRRVQLVGALSLLGLIASLGLFASRPAHSVGGPVAVAVSNTPLATKPVDVASPTQPFLAFTQYVVRPNGSIGILDTADGYTDITVPAGKRLVIQAISESRGVGSVASIQCLIPVFSGQKQALFELPMVAATGVSNPGVTESLTLYEDAGSTLSLIVERTGSSGTDYIEVSVMGYLVNV